MFKWGAGHIPFFFKSKSKNMGFDIQLPPPQVPLDVSRGEAASYLKRMKAITFLLLCRMFWRFHPGNQPRLPEPITICPTEPDVIGIEQHCLKLINTQKSFEVKDRNNFLKSKIVIIFYLL